MKIAFVIRALGLGGTERQLVNLAAGLARRGHRVDVFAFYAGWPDREHSLRQAGVTLNILRKRGRWDVLGFGVALHEALTSCAPDIVYSFLPTSNVVSGLALSKRSRIALVWGMRASNVKKASYDWLGRVMNQLEGWMRSRPDCVIANSRSGVRHCLARGFPESKLRFVPNGIDGTLFRFDVEARQTLRRDWGIDGLIVGFAGRLDPIKGLGDLFTALALSEGTLERATLVVAGAGRERYARKLRAGVATLGLAERVRWLGSVSDMSAFYSAIDILCLPSYGEGTSNVVAESLACGCPCVVTAVGDAEALIGNVELVARPSDPYDLLRALNRAVELVPHLKRGSLREQVLAKLAWPTVIEATEQVLQQTINLHRGNPRDA